MWPQYHVANGCATSLSHIPSGGNQSSVDVSFDPKHTEQYGKSLNEAEKERLSSPDSCEDTDKPGNDDLNQVHENVGTES